MRILQVITSLEMGGAETLLVNMIPRLQALGHVVDLCVFNGKETPLMNRLKGQSPQTKVYILGTGYYNPIYIFKLMRMMRRYDIVHTHNSSPQLFVALASILYRPQLCTTEHNTSNRKRNWGWYRPIERWMYGRYSQIICISNIAAQKLREYMGRGWNNPTSPFYKRISTINNGIDVESIHTAKPCQELLEKKKHRCAILMVAAFRKQKDQDTLVRALALLPKTAYEVWFAGVGERLEEVKKLCETLDVASHVRFLGVRTDIPQVLQAADIIVMSSHWEGLSLSNVEGMSAGKPFIASDVNGLREVTKDWGLLFPHEDVNKLAALLQLLATDDIYYKQIAHRCYERAQQFDINKMVQSYNQVYLGLCKTEQIMIK